MMRSRRSVVGLCAVMLSALASPAWTAPQSDGQRIVSVTITGLRAIAEPVVLAQIESLPGTPFAQATAEQDVVRLQRLHVFSDVRVVPTAVDGGVIVNVFVVETTRVLPGISLALTDQAGASVGPSLKLLSVNGRPREMGLSTRFGGETVVEFTETSPLLTRRRMWRALDMTFATRANELEHFNERSAEIDARIGVRGSERWKVGAIAHVYAVRSDQAGMMLSTGNVDVFPGFGAVAEYDTRNSSLTPTRGWLNSIDGVWHSGSGTYGTLNLDVRRFQPLFRRQTILATALLTVQSGTRGVDVPTYADYALGGENSVRGWTFAARRGKNQAIGSLEYRFTLVPTQPVHVAGLNLFGGVALAVFGDVGSAWSVGRDLSHNTVAGGGIGLRLFVPFVSVVRLDFCYGSAGHVGFGINEKADAQRNRVR